VGLKANQKQKFPGSKKTTKTTKHKDTPTNKHYSFFAGAVRARSSDGHQSIG